MTKMVSRLQSSKKITAVLHTLVRDNQVLCPETRLASFLRAIGVAKLMSDRTDWLTFTSPIFRDCLLRQFYPPCDDIIETIDISDSTPLNYMVSVLLKALPYIKAREILDPLVTYTKGLAEAALHAELYRIIHAFFRNQDVSILTETKVVEGSDVRCDLWLRAGLAEFGLELKTERNNGYLQQEANPQILKYASSRKPREMVLLNFVKKEADSITFPINIKPQGWITYPNTKFSVLIVKVMGDVQTGLRFGYALNGDNSWSELTV